jgi:hypothetical protein
MSFELKMGKLYDRTPDLVFTVEPFTLARSPETSIKSGLLLPFPYQVVMLLCSLSMPFW